MKSSLHTLLNNAFYTPIPTSFFNRTIPSSDSSLASISVNRSSFYIPAIIGGAFLSIITIAGNLLIILAYFRNEKIRSISNVPILSLAFTDMFIGFLPVTMNIMEMSMGYWPLGKEFCNVALVLDYVSIQSSINHIVLINFDRYLSIRSPMKHRLHQKTSKVITKLFTVWLIAVIIWVPYINIYKHKVRSSNLDDRQCYKQFSKVQDFNFKRYASITTSLIGYFLPLGIVIITYWKMYFIVRQQLYEVPKFCHAINAENKFSAETTKWKQPPPLSDEMPDNTGDMQKNLDLIKKRKRILRHKKALRMIASIISAFVITGLPLNAQWLLVGMCTSCYNKTLFDIFNFLTYPNSTVNPFLYAYVSRTFRLEFKKLLLCKFLRNYFSDSKEKHVNYRVNYNAKELSRSEST
ncbi:muscarinic acetylcholine receptor M1 [Hydra vulgaris]|uniref:muscarinic acetylcholine receptor M1 n=1 Tax=Hydra vulgaris TaxID=6087 RepID=UPI001F5F5768|nr:muscarinic acetylcholine receptor M1 [Hydra vulgaris]XP_047143661.1 muscarinic acetylcholine receptor M1 [Hydra vulgaris]XP_047143662.1 muscarinic acetylcholine receptor M1 [Hydra vulgaris]XP_047143663.1 muscarinic acetylcholine receptor M1 [Hydra vulgaris]XP_047143664.1 muscarinic acetylcholine receptor M1 [Hydra vulgaris]XP_047143665.1 muscarinic acetylcholine receptor M1 [Hydra vulgaris]